jgi:hypothetical protein
MPGMAKGGILNGPTIIPMANGSALAGEAGPEAVLPLERDSSGRLGVASPGQMRDTARTDELLEQVVGLLAQRQRIDANVVDHRDVVTEQTFRGRMGEKIVMDHVYKNQRGN